MEVTDDIDRRAGVEFYNGILMPDMVDAHCHLELSYLRGLIPRGSGFAGFARAMGEVRRRADAQTRLRAAADADRDLWRQGVGAVVDICNGEETFQIKRESAIEYVNEAELYGLAADSAAPMERLVSSAAEHGLRAAVTPHSIYSLSDAAFRAAVAASDGRLPLSIHFMESPAEAELFAGRGPLAEWYAVRGWTTDFLHYGSPARRVVESVPADRDVLLVHDCCVDEQVVDTIEEHFTGRVTWVLCPRSNDYISGLVPPVELFRRKGVHVALGTDSLASNDSLDIAAEIAALVGSVPLVEALVWATEGGAAAIGAQDRMGTFEPGRRSGAVLLTGVDFDSMTLRPDARTVRLL